MYEIKLNDEFLMSSMFTVAEVEIGRLPFARLAGSELDVVVGGLGLGYTARTVLENSDVRSLIVVDALHEVIEWHERGLIPGETAADPRCRLVHGDFFAMLLGGSGFDPDTPDRRFDAVILDIDHSPRHFLHPDHAAFYQPEGLRRLAERLLPGGVFALWSNDPPDDEFTATLARDFVDVTAEVVTFANPLQDHPATNTIYLATVPTP